MEEYHDSIGGPPEPTSTKKGKKGAQKRTASEALDSPAPSTTKKRGGRKSLTNGTDSDQTPFVLPKGSWEADVSTFWVTAVLSSRETQRIGIPYHYWHAPAAVAACRRI